MGEEPELYAADETKVTETSFEAEWRPMKRVQSYDLQINREGYVYCPVVISESFSKFETASTSNIASSLDNYMDHEGWKGTYLFPAVKGLRIGGAYTQGSLITPMLDVSSSDGVVSMKMTLSTYGNKTDDYVVKVMIVGGESQTIAIPAGTEKGTYSVALNCNTDVEQKLAIVITKGYPVIISSLDVYAGDVTQGGMNMAKAPTVEGDQQALQINCITDCRYLVEGLLPGETYYYRLRALRNDGTYTAWTALEQVTLNGQNTPLGDLNHDGTVDVTDVNMAINIVLGKITDPAMTVDADMDNNGVVDVTDINALINLILKNGK